jgi:antitoxin ParD1/3/4
MSGKARHVHPMNHAALSVRSQCIWRFSQSTWRSGDRRPICIIDRVCPSELGGRGSTILDRRLRGPPGDPGSPVTGTADTNDWYTSRMGRNTSFSLDEHFNAFIDVEVASGRYRSASDVVRAALRLLEERETRLNALREALIAGENSGASTPFDFDAFVARKRTPEPHGR